jgi:hypothetical protein
MTGETLKPRGWHPELGCFTGQPQNVYLSWVSYKAHESKAERNVKLSVQGDKYISLTNVMCLVTRMGRDFMDSFLTSAVTKPSKYSRA